MPANETSPILSPAPAPSARAALAVALGTTAAVTALSYLLPQDHAATGVALAFLGVTYHVALRGEHSDDARRFGLSLGGLLDREPLDARRLSRDAGRALAWAALAAGLLFPPFWLGYVWWWGPPGPFSPVPVPDLAEEVLGQLLVIALPEEAFYRGYLQRSLDDALPPRWSIFGARLGPGLLLASALFALGHLLTELHPNRLAVFFPALAFGWLRARTGGIGAGVAFHAACNVFASVLARGYGFSP